MDNICALEKCFNELGLPDNAITWLLEIYHAIQILDDIQDKEFSKIESTGLDRMIWFLCIGIHTDSFFVKNKEALIPVMATSLIKWQAANLAEENKLANEKSFVWRSSYFDLVIVVAIIIFGYEKAKMLSPMIMNMYGENYSDYIKEIMEVKNA